jgi:oligopeptide transport system substrate-binding protein
MSLLKQWRHLLLAMLAIVALGALAACGDDDDDDTGDDGGSPTATTTGGGGGDERIEGGEITAQHVEPQSLDPHFSSFAQDISVQRMIWRGLYSLDTDNEPFPAMADGDPEISADGLTVTVAMKDGIQWSDGDDLLAEDFVLGIQRTCNPVNAGEYQYLLANIAGCDEYYGALAGPDGDPGTGDDLAADDPQLETLRAAVGVEASDDHTVVFTLENPQPTFPIILSLWMTFPVPAHILPDPGATWPANPDVPSTLVFNGPYMMTGYTAGTDATFEPNPNWKAEYGPFNAVPTLDKYTIRWIDDFAVAQRAYENDELDQTTVDLTQLAATVAEFEPTGEYFKHVKAGTRGLEMNVDNPPLDNKDVRMAFGKAIDWQKMIDDCYSGGHLLTTSWLPEGVAGGQAPDWRADEYAFDPAAAQALVEGVAGMDRTFVLVVRVGTETECQGQFIQEQLRTNLNVEVQLDAVEGPVRSARFREETFDLFPGGWNQDYPDPENWILGLFDTGGSLNHYNCSNEEIDSLIAENQFNTDNDARIAAYERINEIIVDEVCGIFVYYHEADHFLVKPRVVGMLENMTVQVAQLPGDWACETWGVTE